MHTRIHILFLSLLFTALSTFAAPEKSRGAGVILADTAVIPLGGNTWSSSGGDRSITKQGIVKWKEKQSSFETYFRVNTTGAITINLRARTDDRSTVAVSVNGIKKEIDIPSGGWAILPAGTWNITDTGYVKISLSAISRTGDTYADISDYLISGSAVNDATAFTKNNEGNFFYWGRRGPSVHLNYTMPADTRAEWFYNEITVPEGQDIIGSYYMATGFGEGYFGMQVNSPTERRILFSVWSPHNTDDPKSIPPNLRIEMLKKGKDVYTGEFGNEGSGGQSFLKYPWKAGVTYKFLLNGHPDGAGNTIYTAYFFAPEKGEWVLIASFKRPETNTYLTRFHSFLENFSPNQGDKERYVLFGNQWICDNSGKWYELRKAQFTFDNTAAKGYRMDYAGGLKDGRFYLKNCGFFAEHTPYRSEFVRPATKRKPLVDFEKLP